MSFLDNLESNLKSMESRDERVSPRERERGRKEADRVRAAATAPFTEQLRRGPFTADLLNEATRIGYGLRTKVRMTWIDGVLRLDAREHRLELKATAEGILARFYVNQSPTGEEIIDASGSARKLAERWLGALAAGKSAPASHPY